MNLNAIGSISLLISGIVVLFSLVLSFASLNLKLKLSFFSSVLVDLIFKNKKDLRKKIYRFFLWISEGISSQILNFLKLSKNQGSKLASLALRFNFLITLLAVLVLMIQLVSNDYTSKYVVNYSSENLSIFYRVTALWAGSSGSLLFWYFLLNFFTFVFLTKHGTEFKQSLSLVVFILGLLQLIFIFLMLYYEDAQPFLQYPVEMQAGKGLNPLLLHWAMIIHPPVLYVGYVSFAIPFVIAVIMILKNQFSKERIYLIRKWALISWFFLGFGILLGSKWAYEELGWGGYWAWDPVENASLMPFMLSTAFLHSLLVFKNRNMLKFWTFFLMILTYHFCLLGTWITRSGVIEGPHSFAKSDIGYPLIFFIAFSFIFFLRFLYLKRKVLLKEAKIDAFTSKEGSILISNFIFLVSVLIILIGVFSPLLPLNCNWQNGFECFKTEWKPTTYNKIMVPVGIVVLILIALTPSLHWRKPLQFNTIKIPLFFSLIGGIVYTFVYFLYLRPFVKLENSPWGVQAIADFFSILVVIISLFSIYQIIEEYIKGIQYRKLNFKQSTIQAFLKILSENQSRYGGYFVHLSIVFMFIGFSGGAFKTEYQVQFYYQLMRSKPNSEYIYYFSGDKAYISGYVIEAREFFIRPYFEVNADKTKPIHLTVSLEAHYRINPTQHLPVFTVSYGDPYENANRPASFFERSLKFMTGFILDGRMTTERRYYPQVYPYTGDLIRNQLGFGERLVTSEPDIKSAWVEDLYIQVGIAYDPQRNRTPDLASMFEYYYFDLKKNDLAYQMIFPSNLIVDLFVWINPLIKFIWLGMILFFVGGLLVLLPTKKST